MKLRAWLSGVAAWAVLATPALAKERVLVLTDIENEPDDAMSMVRFLVYANQFDIEGLVATTSIHQQKKTAAWRIREIVDSYAKVRDNLELHEKGFPTADSLRAVIVEGRPDYGMHAVGKGMDSPGSELLIKAVDRADARPLWVPVWGGPNVLAQALWKVRETRSHAELARFVAKLRVYTISDQDDSGPWIRKNFPGLFYVASPASTVAARITSPPGAASAATNSTAASPARISPSSTTRGWISTSGPKARWARSTRR
jgi:hypothetical protein